jgi:N-acetyltransferase 10
VSYGLTKELFKFWDKNGFKAVYLKQNKNEITGENSTIMMKPLFNCSLNLDFFFEQFRKKFISLLCSDFRSMDLFTGLALLKPSLSTN